MDNLHLCKYYYNMGKSLDKCFGCEYCFIQNYRHENMMYPDDKLIPVGVNMFYGDPMLQVDTTVEILDGLEKRKHKGEVIVITKGDFSLMPDRKFNLNLWYGFSTFGINHKMDGGTLERFENSIAVAKSRGVKCFIKFAPVLEGINDTDEAIDNVAKHKIPVSYMGMDIKDPPLGFKKKIKPKCNSYRRTETLMRREHG